MKDLENKDIESKNLPNDSSKQNILLFPMFFSLFLLIGNN